MDDVPKPGFSREPPAAEKPGFDPSESPLAPGGRLTSAEPTPADSALRGLTQAPQEAARCRVMVRVRREGWVARRAAAQSRFGNINRHRPSSASRLMAGLDRRGLLERSKSRAVRGRFNLRGLL